MSEPPREEASRWLRQAEDDLRCAEYGVSGRFFAQTCFLAQQAAEKAVKALHYLAGERVVLGHSVSHLAETLPPGHSLASYLLEAARLLDQLYVPTRYPNGLPAGTPSEHYTEAQARDAIARSHSIIAAARAQVGPTAP